MAGKCNNKHIFKKNFKTIQNDMQKASVSTMILGGYGDRGKWWKGGKWRVK